MHFREENPDFAIEHEPRRSRISGAQEEVRQQKGKVGAGRSDVANCMFRRVRRPRGGAGGSETADPLGRAEKRHGTT